MSSSLHPVFMPRNEEEVMQNIINLSSQLTHVRDIPQITISFDQQTYMHVFFTVIIVRVTQEQTPSVQKLFDFSETTLAYIHDWSKKLGYIKNEYMKEATVFRVKLVKDPFVRRDHSLDLYKARRTVFHELTQIFGKLRDFNGGMLAKQNELLCAIKNLIGSCDELLLENFFYSMTPALMRPILKPEALKTLFLMLNEIIETNFFADEAYALKIKVEDCAVYAMVKAKEESVQDELDKAIIKLNNSHIAKGCVNISPFSYMGYLFSCSHRPLQHQFCHIVQNIVTSWETKKNRLNLRRL